MDKFFQKKLDELSGSGTTEFELSEHFPPSCEDISGEESSASITGTALAPAAQHLHQGQGAASAAAAAVIKNNTQPPGDNMLTGTSGPSLISVSNVVLPNVPGLRGGAGAGGPPAGGTSVMRNNMVADPIDGVGASCRAMMSRRNSVQSLDVIHQSNKPAPPGGGCSKPSIVRAGTIDHMLSPDDSHSLSGTTTAEINNSKQTTTAAGAGGAVRELIPELLLHDFYHDPEQQEEDSDWERFLENLQEIVYAYDALPTHERLPHYQATGGDLQPLRELIAKLEKDPVQDNLIPRITPELVHFTWDGLRRDQRTIVAHFNERFRAIRGDAPLPKLGYAKARIGRGERVSNAMFVPRKHQVTPAQFVETLKTKWNLAKPSMYVKLDFGTRHPCSLSTPELLHEPAFKSIVEQANFQLGKKGGVLGFKNVGKTSTSSGRTTSASSARKTGRGSCDRNTGSASPSASCVNGGHQQLPNAIFSTVAGAAAAFARGRSASRVAEDFGNNASSGPTAATQQPPQRPSAAELEERYAHLRDEVDEVLFSRLVNVLTAVLQAAYMSNIWVIVDRSDSIKSSPTSELLLELALQKCEKLPVILCLDSLQRYQTFRPSFKINEQLLHLYRLSLGTKPADEPTECFGVHSLYKPGDFTEWKQFHFRNPHEEYTGGGGGTAEEREIWLVEGDRRLPRKPEDAMVQTNEHHVMMKTHDGRRLVTAANKWLYHYRQYLYSSCTHYVLFENATDSSLPLEKFGGEGRIFAHGGNLTFDRITDWISRGKPTVILLNTGGVAQSFGSLHYWCVTKKGYLEILQPSEAARRQLILEKVSLVSREPWARKFGLSHIMMMQELEKRAPDVMRKSVIVVDGLREGPEAVVEKLTGCFAQSSLGLPELGLGTAEEDVVIEAWKMHMTLIKNAKIYRKQADLTYFLNLLLGWLGAFFSVYYGVHVAQECRGDQKNCAADDLIELLLRNFLLIIPIVAGALGAYISHRRYLQKWGATYTAAGQIVSEIYKFRCHVNEYNPFGSADGGQNYDGTDLDEAHHHDDDHDHASKAGAASSKGGLSDDAGRTPRKVFVANVQEIYGAVLESLNDDAMAESWTGKSTVADVGNQDFKAKLRDHVPRTVLRCGRYYARNGGASGADHIEAKLPKTVAAQLKRLEALGVTGAFSQVTKTIAATASGGAFSSTSKNAYNAEEGGPEVLCVDHEGDKGLFIEEDDFVSPMTIETYVEFRLRVLLALFQKQAPPLSRRLSRLETLQILVTASGTFLAAVLLQHWVVLTVALATSIANIAHYMCLSPRLSSLNAAIRDLRSVMILMDSLSVVEKRTIEKRTYAVATVEAAVLSTVTAWTGNAGRGVGGDKGEVGGGGADGRKEET